VRINWLGAWGRTSSFLWTNDFGLRALGESGMSEAFSRGIFSTQASRPGSDSASLSVRTASAVPADDGIRVVPHNAGAPADDGVWVLPMNGPPILAAGDGAADLPVQAIGLFQSNGGAPTSVIALDALSGPTFVDMSNRTILAGTAQELGGLGRGDGDVLVIGGGNGDIGAAGSIYERVVLLAGSSYSLTSSDQNVAAGKVLTLSGAALGPQHGFTFDGSAETDGSFVFEGGAGADGFTGGSGNDVISGGGGGDRLRGGAGADRFTYNAASESSGKGYDSLLDFNFGEDRIDLPVAVGGFSAAVSKGSLSTATFDSDLAKALGGLGAGQAAFFTPDKGELSGKSFLVVDGNGKAGYQAGEDYVFLIGSAPPADLGTAFFV
jgi:hypothetical protein